MTTTPDERPTLKLGIAFAGMCVLMLQHGVRELRQHDFAWTAWVMAVCTIGMGIWVSWTGVFRSAFLHWLWGWMCSLAVLSMLVMIATNLQRFSASPWEFLPEIFALSVTGWLLVVDRDVARYRTHLRKLENNRSKLRL